jgi:3-hydroxybutyryl-CoA dehydrogenase
MPNSAISYPAHRIGVVGAGTIGITVVADLVLHGFTAVLVESDPAVRAAAPQRVAEAVRLAPLIRPRLPRLEAADLDGRIAYRACMADLADCDFVIENATEEWSIKREIYRHLDTVLAPGVGIGANTSSIPIGRLAAETARADLVVGVHFMNPSYATRAVEVMRGAHTSDECVADVDRLVRALGKKVIVVGDFPGFVSNRISHVFFNEAARLVQDEGVAPAVVDEVFKSCFGHRMGPLETADLIGLDTIVLTLRVLGEALTHDRYQPCELLGRKVASGQLGRKSGRGFYQY